MTLKEGDMDPSKLFQIITNSTLLATRLLSEGNSAGGHFNFERRQYCVTLSEDVPLASPVVDVNANHKQDMKVRYSIKAGNKDGLFTIDKGTGSITTAATLDREIQQLHELIVAAEASGKVTHTLVRVTLADVNDNPPQFIDQNPFVTIIEEDDRNLPKTLITIAAEDPDWVDEHAGLLYTASGDGIDGYQPRDAFFSVHPKTGDLLQLRPLNRDPPDGKSTWKIKIKAHDGQFGASSLRKAIEEEGWNEAGIKNEIPFRHRGNLLELSGGMGRRDAPITTTNLSERKGFVGSKSRRINDTNVNKFTSWRHFSKRKHHKKKTLNGNKTFSISRDPKLSTLLSYNVSHKFRSTKMPHRTKRNLKSKDNSPLYRRNKSEQHICCQHHNCRVVSCDYCSQPSMIKSDEQNKSSDLLVCCQKKYFHSCLYLRKRNTSASKKKHRTFYKRCPHRKLEIRLKFSLNIKRMLNYCIANNRAAVKKEHTLKGRVEGYANIHRPGQSTKIKHSHCSQSVRRITSAKQIYESLPNSTTFITNILGSKYIKIGQYISQIKTNDKSSHYMNAKAIAKGHKMLLLHQTKKRSLQKVHENTNTENLKNFAISRQRMRSATYNLHNENEKVSVNLKATETTDKRYEDKHPLSKLTKNNYLTPPNTNNSIDIVRQLNNMKKWQTYLPIRKKVFNSQQGYINKLNAFIKKGKIGFAGNQTNRSATTRTKRQDPATKRLFIDQGGCLRFRKSNIEAIAPATFEEEQLRNVAYLLFNNEEQENKKIVHIVETEITIIVKDINDNAPVFQNSTVYGTVQENGPIDLLVATVKATDSDDADYGTNALLSYAIEKNAVDEQTGRALFSVGAENGELRTALCCLDRETTPEYRLQVVASDGGGFKGTCTVVVRLADVNDNPPILSKKDFSIVIDETFGSGKPDPETLLEITTNDPDSLNYFYYRITEASGWGWDFFGIRTINSIGELFATRPLDYEDEVHRRGFRFLVEVTDRGPGGWSDLKHIDSAWVSVQLRDINDNAPKFLRPEVQLRIREDVASGTPLVTMNATDPDMEERGNISYQLLDERRHVHIDFQGNIVVRHQMDRESPKGNKLTIRVVASDNGEPALSSTATLLLFLDDVNDCPPRLIEPTTLHVTENSKPHRIGQIFATDDDEWSLGHGPPFTFSVSPANSAEVMKKIAVKFYQSLDEGRGGVEVWTLTSLDREENKEIAVDITVGDADGLVTTVPITILVDDVNDNPMKPGSKTVYLWKTRGVKEETAIGRVYVNDPDDWDFDDKRFKWFGKPSPLFDLDERTGVIRTTGTILEGKYPLHFIISDKTWQQDSVASNVTVVVKVIPPKAILSAVSFSIVSVSPQELTKDWIPDTNKGLLGNLLESISLVLADVIRELEVVSIYSETTSNRHNVKSESTSLWLNAKGFTYEFVSPIKLKGLLQLRKNKIESLTGFRISLKETHVAVSSYVKNESNCNSSETTLPYFTSQNLTPIEKCPDSTESSDVDRNDATVDDLPLSRLLSSASVSSEESIPNYFSTSSLTSMPYSLQLVDSNLTSFVTPRLFLRQECPLKRASPKEEECGARPCLNGGRCIPTEFGKRCICPGTSTGTHCKILSRSFSQGGWAWFSPLPQCPILKISLSFITESKDGVLLYSGPFANPSLLPNKRDASYKEASSLIVLQLIDGKVVLQIEGKTGPVMLTTRSGFSASDGKWHHVDIFLSRKKAILVLDSCSRASESDRKCLDSALWPFPWNGVSWGSLGPLEIGGLAHEIPNKDVHGWESVIGSSTFSGCIANLRMSDVLTDLGEPAASYRSTKGCTIQEGACKTGAKACGIRGMCIKRHTDGYFCTCPIGWTGNHCSTPTVPISLKPYGFIKIALSFAANALDSSLHIRFRTRRSNVSLLTVSEIQEPAALKIHIKDGFACLSVTSKSGNNALAATSSDVISNKNRKTKHGIRSKKDDSRSDVIDDSICITGAKVVDGRWHVLKGTKIGKVMVVELNDGDNWKINSSLSTILEHAEQTSLKDLNTDDHKLSEATRITATIGGSYADNESEEDNEAKLCIDDARVLDHPLPLPPLMNGSQWGQVTTMSDIEAGCSSPNMCQGVTCEPPFICRNDWWDTSCRCQENYLMTQHGCQIIDKCLYHPCLNSGTCTRRGMIGVCDCLPEYSGQHCEWGAVRESHSPWAGAIALMGIAVSSLLIVLLVVCMILKLHRFRSGSHVSRQSPNDRDPNSFTLETQGGKGMCHVECNKRVEETFHTSIGIISDMMSNSEAKSSVASSVPSIRGESNPEGLTSLLNSRTCAVGQEIDRIPTDDLRDYAYEGDEHSGGSLGSALSGFRSDVMPEQFLQPLTPGLGEVMDLLQNLPDGRKSSFRIKGSLKPSHSHSNLTSYNVDTTADGITFSSDSLQNRWGSDQLNRCLPFCAKFSQEENPISKITSEKR